MIKKILFLILSLSALFVFPTALAVTVSTLYQGEAPVNGHSAADWQKGAAAAFEQVLIKTSGNPRVGQIDSIRKAMNKVSNFVQSYNYGSLDLGQGRSTTSMQVRFSPKAVNDLLQQAGQPVLPKDRPLTLVLLAIQHPGDSAPVLLNDNRDPVAAALQKEADKVALPLFWPTNAADVPAAQVWSLSPAFAQAAVGRYRTDAVLLGKITATGKGSWQGQWLLVNANTNQNWQTQGNNAGAAVAATLPQFSRYIASTLGAVAAPSSAPDSAAAPKPIKQDVTLKVSGVNGLNDYSALIDYLRSLDVVNDLSVLQTQGDQLSIRVKITGSRDLLIKEIANSNALFPLVDNATQVPTSLTTPPVLLYRWQGVQGMKDGVKPSRSYTPPAMRRPAPTSGSVQQDSYQQQYPPVIDQSVDNSNQGNAQPYPMDDDSGYNSKEQVPYEVSP